MLRRSLLLAGLAAVPALRAQSLAGRPIRIIVPWTAGGGTDVVARAMSGKLGEALGTSIFIENKPGATGVIGTDTVAKAAPDGHTLVLGTNATFSIAVGLLKLPYDAQKDLTPITRVASVPHVLTVHPSVPANTVAELVALAKAKPNGLSFGSSGIGSTVQLAGEQFKLATGTKILHVPYKGSGQSVADTIAACAVSFDTLPAVEAQIKAGRLRPLAILGPRRVPSLPDVPTVGEAGVQGAECVTWYGLYGPGALPAPLVGEIYDKVVGVLATPELKTRLKELGAEDTSPPAPDEFRKIAASEIVRYATVIKAAGIQAQ